MAEMAEMFPNVRRVPNILAWGPFFPYAPMVRVWVLCKTISSSFLEENVLQGFFVRLRVHPDWKTGFFKGSLQDLRFFLFVRKASPRVRCKIKDSSCLEDRVLKGFFVRVRVLPFWKEGFFKGFL